MKNFFNRQIFRCSARYCAFAGARATAGCIAAASMDSDQREGVDARLAWAAIFHGDERLPPCAPGAPPASVN
jgi:hypothetical protein